MMTTLELPAAPVAGELCPTGTGASPDDGRVRVHFTTDVECSVGGAFADPACRPWGYDLRFHGRFANQAREWGVGFIMDTLERYGFGGTFFVEAFGGRYFGIEGLRHACGGIQDRGHDVQLHLHPVMLDLVAGAKRQVHRRSDDCGDYSLDEQVALLGEGLEILSDCGVTAPVAFRAGNFAADANTWQAMRRVGLAVSSNLNLAFMNGVGRNGPCRLPVDGGSNDLFAVPGHGALMELPITCIRALGANGRVGVRQLAIPALSTWELIGALKLARRQGIGRVTLILHSFDFAHLDDPAARIGRPIVTHVRRLTRLCQWLDRNRDAFEVSTVADLAAQGLPLTNGQRSKSDPVPRTSLVLGCLRQLEQIKTRLVYR
ncbi:MAG: hypothetical protein ACE5GE_12440 [Phycisphaerae bacterium]